MFTESMLTADDKATLTCKHKPLGGAVNFNHPLQIWHPTFHVTGILG